MRANPSKRWDIPEGVPLLKVPGPLRRYWPLSQGGKRPVTQAWEVEGRVLVEEKAARRAASLGHVGVLDCVGGLDGAVLDVAWVLVVLAGKTGRLWWCFGV